LAYGLHRRHRNRFRTIGAVLVRTGTTEERSADPQGCREVRRATQVVAGARTRVAAEACEKPGTSDRGCFRFGGGRPPFFLCWCGATRIDDSLLGRRPADAAARRIERRRVRRR